MNPFRSTQKLAVAAALLLSACAKQIQAPEAKASAVESPVVVGAIVQLKGDESLDKNTPPLPLFYQWAFTQVPAGSSAKLNDATLVNPSFTADVAGDYQLSLVVTNGHLASKAAIVDVKSGPCGANRPSAGEISAAPETPNLGAAVQLSATAADADEECLATKPAPLAYAWSIVALPAGSQAKLNLADAQQPSFTADLPGEYQVRLVVTDDTGRASEPAVKTIAVSNCGGAAPVVQAPAATPSSPGIGQLVSLGAEAADADNESACDAKQTLSYGWFFVSLPAGSKAALNDANIVNPSFVADLSGSYVLRVRVSDGTGRSTLSEPLTVDVSSCGGGRPVVSAVQAAPAQPNSGQVVQLTATVTDADSDTGCEVPQSFRYEWRLTAQPAGSRATLNNTGATNPSFVADVPGDYAAELAVTDATGRRSATSSFSVTVSTCGSAAPAATIEAPEAGAIGGTVQLGSSIADADTQAPCTGTEVFSYEWSFDSLPQGSHAQLNAGGIDAPSFVPDVAGDYVLRLVAVDSAGHRSAPAFETVVVSACGGNAPVAAAEASTSSPGIGQAVLLTATATDADNEATCGLAHSFSYAWSFDSLPAGSRATLNSASAVSPSFTPDLAGDYKLRLYATDSTGRRSDASFITITASSCGAAAPVASIAASSTSPGIAQAVLLTASATDADNAEACGGAQTFTYAWAFDAIPAGSRASLNSTTAVKPSFSPDLQGDYTVRLVATDSTGRESAAATLKITASACGGAAPALQLNASTTSPGLGQAVQLAPTATDADNEAGCDAGQTFTYAWAFDSLPAGSRATLNSASAVMPSFTTDVAGAYVVRAIATDSTGRQSAPETIRITASTCGANLPVATANASTTNPGIDQAVLLTASATDADNDSCGQSQSIAFRWWFAAVPAGSLAQLNSATATSPSFVPDLPGEYDLRLVATDSTGRASEAASLKVTASSCGAAAPVAAVVPTTDAPAIGEAVLLAGAAADADNTGTCSRGQTFAFAWAFESLPAGSRASLNSLTATTPSFTPDVAGEYVVRLVVTDSTGRASSPETVTITADACGGNRPTATVTATPGSVGVGMALTLLPEAIDADNLPTCQGRTNPNPVQTFSYEWTILSAPLGSNAQLSNESARAPGFVADVAGTYTVRLVVTDSTGLESRPIDTPITVDACGSNAPSIGAVTASNATPNVGGDVLLTATFDDADNGASCQGVLGALQTHSYWWSLVKAPAASSTNIRNSNMLGAGFTPDVAGEYQFELVVSDSTGLYARSTVTITASTCGGAAPTAAPSIDAASELRVNGIVQLRSNATDSDNALACGLGQALSYQWFLVEQPAGSRVFLGNGSVKDVSFTPDVAGTYVAAVQVRDSTGRTSATSLVTVTVSACGGNRPVAVISAPTTAVLNADVQFDALGTPASSDADNALACGLTQTLHFYWEIFSAPAGSSLWLRPSMNVSNPSIRVDAKGTYVLRLWVTDSTNLTSEPAIHTLTVN